jgi:hypothetical protein
MAERSFPGLYQITTNRLSVWCILRPFLSGLPMWSWEGPIGPEPARDLEFVWARVLSRNVGAKRP